MRLNPHQLLARFESPLLYTRRELTGPVKARRTDEAPGHYRQCPLILFAGPVHGESPLVGPPRVEPSGGGGPGSDQGEPVDDLAGIIRVSGGGEPRRLGQTAHRLVGCRVDLSFGSGPCADLMVVNCFTHDLANR